MTRAPGAQGGAADPYEADLVRRAQLQDVEAFAELYRRYRPAILRLANSKLRDYDVAEEIVQDTFIRAYVSIKRFDTSRPFGPWLATIAANLIVDVKRRWGRYVPTDHADHVVRNSGRDEPLERVLSLEAVRRVRSVIQQLPSRQRRILEATAFHEMSASEVALMERTSESSVTSAVYRARAGVRRGLRRLATVFVVFRTMRQRAQQRIERFAAYTRSEAFEATMGAAAPAITAILALVVAFSIGTIGVGGTSAIAAPVRQDKHRLPIRTGSPELQITKASSKIPAVKKQEPIQTSMEVGPTRKKAILPSSYDLEIRYYLLDGYAQGSATGFGYDCGPRQDPLLPAKDAPVEAWC